ncbi:MAG TPA: M23 family metallopeptidase [Vicinamibacterales bacterium]|nr:M23 family metallopeptidase [Vicinamibacterales bacterium]
MNRLALIAFALVTLNACDASTSSRLRGAERGEGVPAERLRGAGAPALNNDVALLREAITVSATVGSGATLASMLRAQGVAVADALDVVAQASSVFDVRRIRTAQPYRLQKTIDGALRFFEYEIDGDRFLRVARTESAALAATVLPIPKTGRVETVRGRIGTHASSLSAAMDEIGETVDLTLALAEIFGGEIDFSTEVQPGDTFELTVEKRYRAGIGFAGYGPVIAAQFVNAGRTVRAVRFAPEGGAPGYFDERGVSLKRFFLASPLKFQPVVTSGFSRSRMHPILREPRAHLGVDYRAPAGSPVIAASDGVVVFAGSNGGSGRMVHLRHGNAFETEYLHLSSIAVRAGARVRQGDLIGRVGSTGLATGPHLDYRVKRNGAFVNPLTAHRAAPPAEPVPPPQMSAFAVVRDQAFSALTPAVTQASTGSACAEPQCQRVEGQVSKLNGSVK